MALHHTSLTLGTWRNRNHHVARYITYMPYSPTQYITSLPYTSSVANTYSVADQLRHPVPQPSTLEGGAPVRDPAVAGPGDHVPVDGADVPFFLEWGRARAIPWAALIITYFKLLRQSNLLSPLRAALEGPTPCDGRMSLRSPVA